MTTAFVLSGGASLGAVQVGMLQALAEHGIHPDLLVGTSAGALNAAYIAGHGHSLNAVETLARVWNGLRGRDLFGIHPRHVMASMMGRSAAVCPDRGLRRLIANNLTFETLEEAPIPCVIVATDFLTGEEVAMSTGSAMDAVLASCAIPGVFPPVWREGRPLVDGGLSNNAALSQAMAIDADRIIVLPSGYSCALTAPPRSALGSLLHAFSVLTHQRLVGDLVYYADHPAITVLPPPCPIEVSAMNFSQADRLIEDAYRTAMTALDTPDNKADPARRIGSHHHRSAAT